jgi:hypothetical protein
VIIEHGLKRLNPGSNWKKKELLILV